MLKGMRLCWAAGLLLAGCGSDGSNPESGEPPPVPGPEPYVESGFAGSNAAFAPFANQLLGLFVIGASEEGATGDAEGVNLSIAADGSSLSLQFQNQITGAVGAPVVLVADPAVPGLYAAADVAAFGREHLQAQARVRVGGPDGDELALLFHSVDAVTSKQALTHEPGAAGRARAYQQRYLELMQQHNVCNTLERFALLLQDIVDTNVRDATPEEEADVTKDLIIDDLADIFVPAGFYKTTIMLLPPTVQENVITDPPLRCSDATNLSGFSDVYVRGEGRFRHFAANAAMKRVAPGFLVNLGARLVGGDWEFKSDASGDIAADLATNAAGREFHDFLEQAAEDGTFGDGHSVKDWIRQRFQDALAGRKDLYVRLDHTLGPHAAGSEVGLCRVSRSCRLGGADAGCDADHLHAQPEGISIDDVGEYADPAPMSCGYGKTAERVYP